MIAGAYKQICVIDSLEPLDDANYSAYVQDPNSWAQDIDGLYYYFLEVTEFEFVIVPGNSIMCGNVTSAAKCPQNSTCLPDIWVNPNLGLTSFDNFGAAFLTSVQVCW